MEKRRYKAHFIQWETTPNIEYIIDTLRKKLILPNYIYPKNWVTSINDIIQALNEEIKKDDTRWDNIELSVYITNTTTNIKDSSSVDEEMLFNRVYGINFDYLPDGEQKVLLKSVLLQLYSLEISIMTVLEENLHLRRLSFMRRRDLLLSWYPFLKDIIEFSDRMKEVRVYDRRGEPLFSGNELENILAFFENLNLSAILESLKSIMKEQDITWGIKILLNKREFLSALLSRIDIFKDFVQKEDLIKQFEKRKEQKKNISQNYLIAAISLFSFIFLVNLLLFIFAFCKHHIFTFSEFIHKFFGQNIFIFSIELICLFLALYFLSIYKSFLRIIELYDSHILLIESDFFYKNDGIFQNYEDSSAIFEMRKENAQKIHSLPEKTFILLNGKEKITNEMPMVKIIENFLEITRSVIKK